MTKLQSVKTFSHAVLVGTKMGARLTYNFWFKHPRCSSGPEAVVVVAEAFDSLSPSVKDEPC